MPSKAKRNTDAAAPSFLDPSASAGGVYLRADGPVAHLAAESLERPIEMPRNQMRKVLVIAAIALAFSVAVIVAYNVTVLDEIQHMQQQVAAQINRGVALDLPKLSSYAGKTNDAMKETFKADGYTMYDNSNDEDENVDGFDMYKLAPDVDPDEAAAAYAQGIENLGSEKAARYLAGSWRFLVARGDEVEMRLRYADFDSADAVSAIQAAIDAEGFTGVEIGDAAEDTMGNTNLSGTFEQGKKTYEYTISACDLSSVYSIEGAPENAQYVGIRVTEAK